MSISKIHSESCLLCGELVSHCECVRCAECEQLLQLSDADICPPYGTPRPDLSLYQLADDVPLVFWDVHIFRQSPGYIRATVFMSADKKKTEFTIETGPSPAGPWKELKRHL